MVAHSISESIIIRFTGQHGLKVASHLLPRPDRDAPYLSELYQHFIGDSHEQMADGGVMDLWRRPVYDGFFYDASGTWFMDRTACGA